jgi:ketosteroid isomerase-like protein
MTPAVCILIASLTTTAPSTPNDAAIARREIAKQYSVLAKAMQAKDFDKFKSMMAEDFVATDPKGATMDRDQVVKDFTVQRERLTSFKWSKKITRLDLDGNVAHVVVLGDLKGKSEFGGKTHILHVKATSLDDWAKTGNSWILKASKTTDFDMTMDGKPMRGG